MSEENLADRKDQKVRLHHYLFAHRMLPSLFHSNPDRFMGALVMAPDEFLSDVWNAVGQQVPEQDRLEFRGISATVTRLAPGTAVAVISLPPPQAVTEAHLVAAVHHLAAEGQAAFAE